MKDLQTMTEGELRSKAQALANSINQLTRYGNLDDIEKVKEELNLVQQERERRYFIATSIGNNEITL